MRLALIAPQAIASRWNDLLPLIVQGLREAGHGELLPPDLKALFEAHQRQAWVLQNDGCVVAIIATRIEEHPTGLRVAWVVLAVGKGLEEGEPLFLAAFQEWARANGCQALAAEGRDGWARRLAKHGWRKDAVVMRKDLQ